MATTRNDDDDSLLQGGPGDQASAAADARQAGLAGSQQGRPQAQEHEVVARERQARQPAPAASGADGERGISATERQAGTPDERATTDWSHGEGEPRSAAAETEARRGESVRKAS